MFWITSSASCFFYILKLYFKNNSFFDLEWVVSRVSRRSCHQTCSTRSPAWDTATRLFWPTLTFRQGMTSITLTPLAIGCSYRLWHFNKGHQSAAKFVTVIWHVNKYVKTCKVKRNPGKWQNYLIYLELIINLTWPSPPSTLALPEGFHRASYHAGNLFFARWII